MNFVSYNLERVHDRLPRLLEHLHEQKPNVVFQAVVLSDSRICGA